ncbi:MAG: hypothetical protein ACKV19_15090 [Verrucomicrobiales bacterium]
MTPQPAEPEDWAQRYEALRREALAPQPLLPATPLGLCLLMRHGVAEWMRRWLLGPPALSSPAFAGQPAPAVPMMEERDQLALLLAQVAMRHLQTSFTR